MRTYAGKIAKLLVVLGCLAAATTAGAQPAPQISGSFGGFSDGGNEWHWTFTCTGAPTCIGTYTATVKLTFCANVIAFSGPFRIDGFTVPPSRLFAGTWFTDDGRFNSPGPGLSNCTYSAGAGLSVNPANYTVTWNGSSGTFCWTPAMCGPVSVTTPSAPPPPFPMTVTSNINATVATASAQIQPAPQDVGTTAGIYVFALAPRSLTKAAGAPGAKDGTAGCVLAQLDPSGQLRAASASNLTPSITGALSAQTQQVAILNNVSTPSVAGASFFVGYGTDSATMIANGINRNAVTIPGPQTCPKVVPETPGALTGLWWNAAESGWGVHFTQRRNVIFAAWYSYDASGNAKWYVASNCAMASANATNGRCAGDLFEVTSSPFFGTAYDAGAVHATRAGSLQVEFADPSSASMAFTAAGVTRTVPIVRQTFGSAAVVPAIDYTDLWWGGVQENGWGVAISHQHDNMFLAWFVYHAGGKPAWYVASACHAFADGNGCSGDLFKVAGPPFGATFDASRVRADPIGSASVVFSDPNTGTLNYTVNGVVASKSIKRQTF